MRKLNLLITLLLVLSVSVSCSASKNNKADKSAEAQSTKAASTPAVAKEESKFSQIDLSFIQTAGSALLKSIPDRGGYYTLTLYDVSPYLTYYTKRPNRLTGLVPIENFTKAWSVGENSFKENNPTGVIVAGMVDGVINKGNKFYLVTYAIPKYNLQRHIVQYTVKPIGVKKFMLDHVKFDNVTLKIN